MTAPYPQYTKPEKDAVFLVGFYFGDAPEFEGFIDDAEPFSDISDIPGLGKITYAATPEMGVELPANTATLKERPLVVTLPLVTDEFSDDVSSMYPFPPCRVQVEEVIRDPSDGSHSKRIVFVGMITRKIRNPSDSSSIIKLEALSAKARCAIRLGVPATHQCSAAALGDKKCQLGWSNIGQNEFHENFDEPGTITAVSGRNLTITGLADHSADTTGRYWEFGYVSVGGLRLAVRRWVIADPTLFQLRREPPPSWGTGAVACVVTPGCDRLIETCRARYDNEQFFSGYGYAMPPYHPSLEVP